MKLLYLDCFAGISGDMLLGALIDLGLSEEHLRNELAKLPLDGYRLQTRRVRKQNLAATKFECVAEHQHRSHRGYSEIAAMIRNSSLADAVKQRATSVFRALAEAEAKVHGIPLEEVHFHEIGAVDSIVDIVGACVALQALGVRRVVALPPPLGGGFVETAHGRFPVPAPATMELLKGLPTGTSPETGELVTPTGAALLAEFCSEFGPMPAMRVEKIGYGAGARELERTPNVLRVVLGVVSSEEADTVTILEANIDDMNPQCFGDVMERLLAGGALEVYLTPVQMKKNRPGTLLTVLCAPSDADRLAELVLVHTTSFGVRLHEARRQKLAREICRVATPYGEIEVKIGRRNGRILTRSPEYESCRRAAAEAGVPVKTVYAAALRALEETSHD